MRLVREHARPQEAFLTLRNVIIPSFDFTRRMLPMWTTQKAAEEIDTESVRTMQVIAGAHKGDWTEDRKISSWIFQGNGLPGLRKMSVTGEAAGIASFVAAARNRPSLEMPGTVTQMITEYNGRVSAKVIKAGTTKELLLETARWPKVQKRLAEKVWQKERISLRSELEPLDLLMMDALQEKKTSCWIKDLDFGSVLEPKQGSKMALADEEFQYLLRRMMPGPDPHGTGLHKLTCH